MYYAYDNTSKLFGVYYDGASNDGFYFFKRNIQGDIIGILDRNGVEVVTYLYDTWGKLISTTGSKASTIGEDNPFRYRGYYYDEETGLYYLNQRYYNPEWGRFISSDNVLGETGTLLSHNTYAYCGNNPVIRADEDGEFWNFIVGAVIGAAIGVVSNGIANAIEGKPFFEGAGTALATGAASGLLASTGFGLVGQAVGNAVISGVSNAYSQLNSDEYKSGEKEFDFLELGISTGIGAVSGLAGGKGAKYSKIDYTEICSVGKYSSVALKSVNGFKPSARLQGIRILQSAARSSRVTGSGGVLMGAYRYFRSR